MEKSHLITGEVSARALFQYFESLAERNAEELDLAVDWFEGSEITLSIADCVRDLRRFAKSSGRDVANPKKLLEALFSLAGFRMAMDWSPKELIEFFVTSEAAELPNTTDVARLKKTLNRFFDNSGKFARTLKAQRIYDGLLPNFEACSSLVEFRPVFDEAREKILQGVISATLTIDMRSVEYPATSTRVSVQLDAKDIDELVGELGRLKKKIKLLKERECKDIHLLNPSRSLGEETK